MIRERLLGAVVAAVLVGLTGCRMLSFAPYPCDGDENCPWGLVCSPGGICVDDEGQPGGPPLGPGVLIDWPPEGWPGGGDGDAPGDGDGDGDGAIDEKPPGSCDVPLTSDVPAILDLDLTGMPDTVRWPAVEGSCVHSEATGPDVVVRVSVPAGRTLRVDAEGSPDLLLSLMTTCARPDATCFLGDGAVGPQSRRLAWRNEAAGPASVDVVVGTREADAGGPVRLTLAWGEAPAPLAPDVVVAPDGQPYPCNQLFVLASNPGFCGGTFAGPIAELWELCTQADPVYLQLIDEQPCCGPVAGFCPPEGFPPPPVPWESESCQDCHVQQNGYDDVDSVEDPHPWATVDCVDCHGGDPAAHDSLLDAHICPPPEVGNELLQVLDPRAWFLARTLVGIEALPDWQCARSDGSTSTVSALQWLQFMSPGDPRVVEALDEDTGNLRGCGACHGAVAESETGTAYLRGGNVAGRVGTSLMTTGAGMHTVARYSVGLANAFPDRRRDVADTLADVGVMARADPVVVAGRPVYGGEVPSLLRAPERSGEGPAWSAAEVEAAPWSGTNDADFPRGVAEGSPAAAVLEEALGQACSSCHLGNQAGAHAAGQFRGTGCSACHFPRSVDGRSRSHDPSIDKYEPLDPDVLTPGERSHPADHRIRNAYVSSWIAPPPGWNLRAWFGIRDQACIACHHDSGGIGLAYRGIRRDPGRGALGSVGTGDLSQGNAYPRSGPVEVELATELFGENVTFAGATLAQWVRREVWQDDATALTGLPGQDDSPADIHHEAGLACIDCHFGLDSHGNGALASTADVQAPEGRIRCETCHGTLDAFAPHDGTHIVDAAGNPLRHTYREVGAEDYWLLSRVDGRVHPIPQVKHVVDPDSGTWPPGHARAGQPRYDPVASAAKGRWQATQDLADGTGPVQLGAAASLLVDGFSHLEGRDGLYDPGLECTACHATWSNQCVGCHLEATWRDEPDVFLYSPLSAERVRLQVERKTLYANPISFLLGMTSRGRIGPLSGPAMWLRYTDDEGQATGPLAFGDRNGLGNDPQLRNPTRNAQPALARQPVTPHTVRGRATFDAVGTRGCADCHRLAEDVTMIDQTSAVWDLTPALAQWPGYRSANTMLSQMARGLGTGLWTMDAAGEPTFETNNAPVYDLDRLVETMGTPNFSAAYPLLDSDVIVSLSGTNGARVTSGLPPDMLARLAFLDQVGLDTVYLYNLHPGEDPLDTAAYAWVLKDYGLVGQESISP